MTSRSRALRVELFARIQTGKLVHVQNSTRRVTLTANFILLPVKYSSWSADYGFLIFWSQSNYSPNFCFSAKKGKYFSQCHFTPQTSTVLKHEIVMFLSQQKKNNAT